MSVDDDIEREHEPTQKRLDDARRRGEVVRSAEIAVAAGYGGLLAAMLGIGGGAVGRFGENAAGLFERADTVSGQLLGGGLAAGAGLIAATILPALPFLILPGMAVLLAILAQRALVFAPEKIKPRLSRIDPLANSRQKFGRSGLFEFAKSAAKLVIISVLLGLFVVDHLPRALVAQASDAGPIARELGQLMVEFLLLVAAISGAMGAVDYLWQQHEHLRRNRMSRKELMDEFKDSEGDPHVKGQRRQRAEAIATNRMLRDVPGADVVIVNPTHYAVALRWDRGGGRAPICVAKGTDHVAARIREIAATGGVPVRSDPPTARAIHATVEIGREISPEHYAPVAAAIRFAEAMQRRAGARRDR